uniref:Uncharacterized protein n=1 Tax=Cannabis sativa TaxID=3483 RepID=A0A803P382_CANSA
MKCGDGSVVIKTVIPSHDAEAQHVALVVKYLQPLPARLGRKARNHVDLAEGAHVAITVDDVAALEKVFVGLWVIEPSHHGPYSLYSRIDRLDHARAALVGSNRVGMVVSHRFRNCEILCCGNDVGLLILASDHGRVSGVDSVELE